MADDTQQPQSNGAATDPNAPQFVPQAVYLKDLSLESPNGPRVPQNASNPKINLNLNTRINDLGSEMREVILTVHVEAKLADDSTLWLVEVQQAGAFAVRNVAADDLQRLLGIFCPGYLLPYARQTISDVLLKSGFPPFLVPPVNFEALFNRAQSQQGDVQATGVPPSVN
jgi:preprotein translocase subunit SecB